MNAPCLEAAFQRLDEFRVPDLHDVRQPEAAVDSGVHLRLDAVDLAGIREYLHWNRPCPGPAFSIMLILEPRVQQAAGQKLAVDAAFLLQLLRERRVDGFADFSQLVYRCAVTPRVQRRDYAAARPGGLSAERAALDHEHIDTSSVQLARGEHADNAAADDDHFRHVISPGWRKKTWVIRRLPNISHYTADRT